MPKLRERIGTLPTSAYASPRTSTTSAASAATGLVNGHPSPACGSDYRIRPPAGSRRAIALAIKTQPGPVRLLARRRVAPRPRGAAVGRQGNREIPSAENANAIVARRRRTLRPEPATADTEHGNEGSSQAGVLCTVPSFTEFRGTHEVTRTCRRPSAGTGSKAQTAPGLGSTSV